METLKELLVEELKDIYSAEKQIIQALPKIIEGAVSLDLKEALQAHLEETKVQVERLDEVFALLEQKPGEKHCKGMEGLLQEGAECLAEEEAGPLRDLQLIGAAQRVEHYEVAAYGTAKAMAEQLGEAGVEDLLGETLDEEEAADETLTEVAESIYPEVSDAGADDEIEVADEPEKKAPRGAALQKVGKSNPATGR